MPPLLNIPPFLLFLFLLLGSVQISKEAVHWGLQQQQNWPFPRAKLAQNQTVYAQQMPLLANAVQYPPPPPPSSPAWNEFNGHYNEYLAKYAEYYNDYYSEYGSRYKEYLDKYFGWLKSATTAEGRPSSPDSMANSLLPPPPPNGLAGPTQQKMGAFHRHRPACPPKVFPRANKSENGNKNGTEPKFAHPLVLPIIHGNFTARLNPGSESNLTIVDPLQQHLAMHSSVTLVIDHDAEGNKHIIVVDTGLALLKHAIFNGMLTNGIHPPQVDTVCITHPDTDTMGNLNLFPCAEVHSGNAISRENLFARQPTPQFENNRTDLPFRHLFVHTELYLTPGMSFQDQSLVVRNVPDHGTVAIVGKLILNEGDLTNNLAIREFAIEDSEHRKLWQATRREIVCMADYIVPGYGVPFKVSAEVKGFAECGGANKKSTMASPLLAWGKKWSAA